MAFFCYIQQAYFDDKKKIRLLNRKSLSDTVKPCTIIWSNGINCHFFSKTFRQSGFCGSGCCRAGAIERCYFPYSKAAIASEGGNIQYRYWQIWRMERFLWLHEPLMPILSLYSFYHIIERYLIDTRVDLACLLPHTWNCIMDELIMKCAQIF